MKAILTIALTAAATYAVIKVLEHLDTTGAEPGSDAANPPSSIDDIPTLRGVRDAEPLRAEPLREEDLNVAQNAPF